MVNRKIWSTLIAVNLPASLILISCKKVNEERYNYYFSNPVQIENFEQQWDYLTNLMKDTNLDDKTWNEDVKLFLNQRLVFTNLNKPFWNELSFDRKLSQVGEFLKPTRKDATIRPNTISLYSDKRYYLITVKIENPQPPINPPIIITADNHFTSLEVNGFAFLNYVNKLKNIVENSNNADQLIINETLNFIKKHTFLISYSWMTERTFLKNSISLINSSNKKYEIKISSSTETFTIHVPLGEEWAIIPRNRYQKIYEDVIVPHRNLLTTYNNTLRDYFPFSINDYFDQDMYDYVVEPSYYLISLQNSINTSNLSVSSRLAARLQIFRSFQEDDKYSNLINQYTIQEQEITDSFGYAVRFLSKLSFDVNFPFGNFSITKDHDDTSLSYIRYALNWNLAPTYLTNLNAADPIAYNDLVNNPLKLEFYTKRV